METVRYLLRVGRTECSPFRIEPAPVARNSRDPATLLKPFRKTLRRAVGQQIRDTVQIQIDKDRAILLSFPPCPIVDPQVADLGRHPPISFLFKPTPYSIIAGADGQPGEKSLAQQSACDVADQVHNLRRATGLTSVSSRDFRQSFAEDLSRAGAVSATIPMGGHPKLDGNTLPRQILEQPAIGAVAGTG